MFHSNRKTRKGFSLVELVVVILIIAILAAAIFLGGATVIRQARASQVKSDLRNMATYAQDMLYENPQLQYNKGSAGEQAYGTQEGFTYDAKTGKLTGATNVAAPDAAMGTAAEIDLKTMPVLNLMNTDYLTDDFQMGAENTDAWDNPYCWSFDMRPAANAGEKSACVIVINSLGENSLDETSDATTTTKATTGKNVAKALAAEVGKTEGYESATNAIKALVGAGKPSDVFGDDYGAVIVMIDGEVSMDYYGF